LPDVFEGPTWNRRRSRHRIGIAGIFNYDSVRFYRIDEGDGSRTGRQGGNGSITSPKKSPTADAHDSVFGGHVRDSDYSGRVQKAFNQGVFDRFNPDEGIFCATD
jgi:hypothetical protein